jgi:hypothetical protein
VHRLLLPAFLLFNFLPILVPVFTMNTNNHKVHITSSLFYLCNTNFPAKTINNPILKFIQWIQEFINVLYKLRTKNQKKREGKKIWEKTESSSKDVETLEIHSSPTLHYKSSVTKKIINKPPQTQQIIHHHHPLFSNYPQTQKNYRGTEQKSSFIYHHLKIKEQINIKP